MTKPNERRYEEETAHPDLYVHPDVATRLRERAEQAERERNGLVAERDSLRCRYDRTVADARQHMTDLVNRLEVAERERDEAFRISEQERADWKLSVEAWQHHYEEEKEALRLERGRKLDALVKYEQLRKVLEEIAAYEDDCIHRRQARAALAEREKP
ncbi:MAG TPA: hypothetical protein VKD72_28850 [Gemmataceae bacterium]|nr:hypothetical protein [Gemmataceae bacterium]